MREENEETVHRGKPGNPGSLKRNRLDFIEAVASERTLLLFEAGYHLPRQPEDYLREGDQQAKRHQDEENKGEYPPDDVTRGYPQ